MVDTERREAEAIISELEAERNAAPPAEDDQESLQMTMMLITAAFLVIARATLYALMEHGEPSLFLTILFAIPIAWVLFAWLLLGYQMMQWLILPKCAVLFIGAMYAHSIEPMNGYIATAVVVVTLLVSASRIFETGIGALAAFLNHPAEVLGKSRKGFSGKTR